MPRQEISRSESVCDPEFLNYLHLIMWALSWNQKYIWLQKV